MEKTIEYVLYKNVLENEFINRIKPIDNAVKKIKKTKDGVVMEEFYNFAPYKNIKTLSELSNALNDNEYLIIDLTQIKKEDEKKKTQDKLYDKIKESIDQKYIVHYIYHDLEKDEPKNQNDKLYLIRYDEISKTPNAFNDCVLVQLKMNPDETCECEGISFSSKHKKELDDELSQMYGGYSGLYYLISENVALELESYYELTKNENNSWDFIKKNKERTK